MMKNPSLSAVLLFLLVAAVLLLDLQWVYGGGRGSVHVAVETTAATASLLTGNDDADRSSSTAPAVVNLNTATQEELETLPGIGPKRAEAILAYRAEHGPFSSIASLTDVPGIGETILEGIQDRVTLSDP